MNVPDNNAKRYLCDHAGSTGRESSMSPDKQEINITTDLYRENFVRCKCVSIPHDVWALVDTIACINLVSESIWKSLTPRPDIIPDPLKVVTATGSPVSTLGRTKVLLCLASTTISLD